MLQRHQQALLVSLISAATLGGVGCKKLFGPEVTETNRCYQPGGKRAFVGSTASAAYPPAPCLQGEPAFHLLTGGCEDFKGISAPTATSKGGQSVCCYDVKAQHQEGCVVGRPLLVRGQPRQARLARAAAGWLA
jgi:hypothetical protein